VLRLTDLFADIAGMVKSPVHHLLEAIFESSAGVKPDGIVYDRSVFIDPEGRRIRPT
jgi:hypothetical protein